MDFNEYGFFDSEITGYDEEGFPILDRAQESEIFALFYSKLISNGVLAKPSNCLMVEANEGMVINIDPGYIIINGHFGYNTQTVQLTVDPAHTSYPRITSVIARVNYQDRKMELILKNGEPSVTPVAPELLQPTSGDYYELCLAEIYVASNQTAITQSNITDTRADSSKCGYVTQLITSLDTSVFYAQLDAFYEEFVDKTNNEYESMSLQMETFLNSLKQSGLNELQSVVDILTAFESKSEEDFTTWFEDVKDQLSEDVAGNLQLQIESLAEREFRHYMGLVNQTTEFLPDGSIVQESDKAVITTVTGYDEDNNKTITQTVEVKSDSSKYVKITTIIQATETENKRIVERYEAYGLAAYTYIAEFASSGGSTSSIASADTLGMVKVGQGLDISEDGTLSVNVETSAEKAASIVEKNMQDFTESEVEDIYDTAEDAQSDV